MLQMKISKNWEYAAMDRNKKWYVFVYEPFKGSVAWDSKGETVCVSRIFNLPTDIPWKESLHERTEYGSWVRARPDLKVDQKLIVWNNAMDKCKRYFSHFDDDGLLVCFHNGTDSWSSKGYTCSWKYYEIVED